MDGAEKARERVARALTMRGGLAVLNQQGMRVEVGERKWMR